MKMVTPPASVLRGRNNWGRRAARETVEQNLAAALTLAQRAYIINNGHIAHEGPAQEIKAKPDILQRYLGV